RGCRELHAPHPVGLGRGAHQGVPREPSVQALLRGGTAVREGDTGDASLRADVAPVVARMSDEKPVPTLYEWMGGKEALERLFEVFYSKVPNDPLLAPVFATMSPHHVANVAAFVGEVFGGPKAYSEEHGGHPNMVRRHVGRALTEEQRARWMQLLLQCADEIGLPSDPEFRSALVGYLEWGTRLAVINSQPAADVGGAAPSPPSAPAPAPA